MLINGEFKPFAKSLLRTSLKMISEKFLQFKVYSTQSESEKITFLENEDSVYCAAAYTGKYTFMLLFLSVQVYESSLVLVR